jgi:hypothetical protein
VASLAERLIARFTEEAGRNPTADEVKILIATAGLMEATLPPALDLDRLDELVREMSEQRMAMESAAADMHRAADRMQSAVRSANEAAGWISGEASRLTRRL